MVGIIGIRHRHCIEKKKENVWEERQKNKAWEFEEIPRLIKVQKTKVAKEQH